MHTQVVHTYKWYTQVATSLSGGQCEEVLQAVALRCQAGLLRGKKVKLLYAPRASAVPIERQGSGEYRGREVGSIEAGKWGVQMYCVFFKVVTDAGDAIKYYYFASASGGQCE